MKPCPEAGKTAAGYSTLDLSSPGYNVEEQDWSVPARDGDGVFVIVTTDLAVEAPEV